MELHFVLIPLSLSTTRPASDNVYVVVHDGFGLGWRGHELGEHVDEGTKKLSEGAQRTTSRSLRMLA